MEDVPEEAPREPASPPVIEAATTGRSGCRACGAKIARGELRLGEHVPNPFAEGETTLWYHPLCAAYRRPEVLLGALTTAEVPDPEPLERLARHTTTQRRLVRIGGAERAPTAQAKCRSCRDSIARGAWRIRIVYVEEGRATPGGFVHLDCRDAYFEGHDARPAILHFSAGLEPEARAELEQTLAGPR